MAISKELLDQLYDRRRTIHVAGGDDKVQKIHDKGRLTARERLNGLFQPETFQEIGAHIRHVTRHFGMADKDLPADGVVVGTGYVDGRQVAAFAQDFTVAAGTLGKMHATKIVEAMKFALKMGLPVVALK
ncbi:MAG: acyl-CoA carboxylase subunit beta, partial [Alphaproteobacteria bacterium]|nr:acyl-CoA carboxylase subunit beta [Alphaproteobacteria bacterium]